MHLLKNDAVDPRPISDQAKEDATKSGGDTHTLDQKLGVGRVSKHALHVANLGNKDYITPHIYLT